MNIALDYDGTYTSAPELWLRFVIDAQAYGHDVRVVTMRYPSEVCRDDFDERLLTLDIPIIATSRKAKQPYCQARCGGWVPHVWIDDNPKTVHADACDVWPENPVLPEGHVHVPVYK